LEVDDLYRRLSAHYNVEGWWPAESPWEIMIGAILTQQTAWENVEKVLGELKRRGLLTVDAIARMPVEELESIIRPAGFYRQKARNIKALASYLEQKHSADPMGILSKDLGEARVELLSLPGIGNETADVMLLFAGGKPCFIAAAYVSRVLGRLGILDSEDYIEVKRFMESRLEPDPAKYARYYALMVQHARATCRPEPRCATCVLSGECAFISEIGTGGSPPRRRMPGKRRSV
jgi:endonuclease-3 related protein